LEGRTPRGQDLGRPPRFGALAVGSLPCRSQPLESRPDGNRPGRTFWSGSGAGRPEKRQERRGPERGTAGREEQDPEGEIPWAPRRLTDRRPARGGASRRGGSQTPRAEDAGAWKPRDNRIPRARMCRRERNPRRAIPSRTFGPRRARRKTGHFKDEPSTGALIPRAVACGESGPGRPQDGGDSKPWRGSTEPNRCYRSREAQECRPTSKECGVSRGDARPPVCRSSNALEGPRGGPAPTRFFHGSTDPYTTQDSPHCPTRSWRASSDMAASFFCPRRARAGARPRRRLF